MFMELILTKLIIDIISFLGLIIGIALYRLTYEEIEIIKPYISWTEVLLIAGLAFYNIYNSVVYGIILLVFLIIYTRYKEDYISYIFLGLVIALSFNKEMIFVNGFMIFCLSVIRGTFIDYEKRNFKKLLLKMLPFVLISIIPFLWLV